MHAERMLVRGLVLVSSLCLVTLGACSGVGRVRPHPLYSLTEPRPPAEALAQLQGPIATVDGVDVGEKGTAFELLPGCHVVTLRRTIGEGTMQGAWMADLGRTVYAFRMVAGRLYSVDVDARFGSAAHGTLTIEAQERDAKGTLLSTVDVADEAAVRACQEWAAQAGAAQGTVPAEPRPGKAKPRAVVAFPGS